MVFGVHYKEHRCGEVKKVYVIAKSKVDAYDKAVYEKLDSIPYSAWVANVTYQNGNYIVFNNFEGKPY